MRDWIETSHARLGKPLRPADLRAFDRLDEASKDRRFRLESGRTGTPKRLLD